MRVDLYCTLSTGAQSDTQYLTHSRNSLESKGICFPGDNKPTSWACVSTLKCFITRQRGQYLVTQSLQAVFPLAQRGFSTTCKSWEIFNEITFPASSEVSGHVGTPASIPAGHAQCGGRGVEVEEQVATVPATLCCPHTTDRVPVARNHCAGSPGHCRHLSGDAGL